ncbi:MAG TPA: phospholipid carrier-dependent glycosyltransferase [Streptosporangiaceae bacterium]
MPTQETAGQPEGPASANLNGLRGTSLAALLRRHWLLAILLAAGLALRVLAQIAYRPALLYIDSIKYLYGAYPGNDPPGYLLVLKPFLTVGNLDVVAAVQHLLGLGMAVALYLLMRRRGVPRWLAALANAPILLDGYQLQMEQTIMPDTLFEALIVTGLAILLWQPHPKRWMIVAAGFALGASAPVRQIGEILILPAVIYLLVVIPGWRAKLTNAATICAAFALPILAVSYRDYVAIKHFALAPYAQSTIYGRAAAAADCQTLRLPAYEQSLCPTRREQAVGPDRLDHGALSPIKSYKPPPGLHGYMIASDFSRRVIAQQPLGVLRAVARDAVKMFALQRVQATGDTPISRWQFQAAYPSYPPYIAFQRGRLRFAETTPSGRLKVLGRGQPFGGGPPVVVRPVASFLRVYQLGGGYAPGPLLLLAAVAGLLGSLGLLRRRGTLTQRETAAACLVNVLAAAGVLLGSDIFEFSWRYQLPALVTLVPAGALGTTVVIGFLTARRGQPAGPPVSPQPVRAAPMLSDEHSGLQAKDGASAG